MPKVGLNRGKLIASAMAMADEHGLASVSMHSLARLYGVAAPSMYKHVKNLEDIQQSIASEALVLLEHALRNAGSTMTACAEAYRRFATDHPGLYETTQLPALFADEKARATSNRISALLASALPDSLLPDDVVNQVRIVRSLLHGFVTLERTGSFGSGKSVDKSFEELCTTLELVTTLAGVGTRPSSPDRLRVPLHD